MKETSWGLFLLLSSICYERLRNPRKNPKQQSQCQDFNCIAPKYQTESIHSEEKKLNILKLKGTYVEVVDSKTGFPLTTQTGHHPVYQTQAVCYPYKRRV